MALSCITLLLAWSPIPTATCCCKAAINGMNRSQSIEVEADDQDDNIMAARAEEVRRLLEEEQARGGGDLVHSSDADSDGCVPMKAPKGGTAGARAAVQWQCQARSLGVDFRAQAEVLA